MGTRTPFTVIFETINFQLFTRQSHLVCISCELQTYTRSQNRTVLKGGLRNGE